MYGAIFIALLCCLTVNVYCQEAVDCGTETNPTYDTCHVKGNKAVKFFGFGVSGGEADKIDSEDCLEDGFVTVVEEIDEECNGVISCDTLCPGGEAAAHDAGKWVLVQECPGVTKRSIEQGLEGVMIAFIVCMSVLGVASLLVGYLASEKRLKWMGGGLAFTVLFSSGTAAIVGWTNVLDEQARIEGLVEDAATDALCAKCPYVVSWVVC
jgi:hypothetical protein